MRALIFAIIFIFLTSPFSLSSVISDIDKPNVELSTRFDGTSILVFGALSPENDSTSLLIEIIGPSTSVNIRKKVQIWGIWVNKKIAHFQDIPSFYQISISNPEHPILEKIENKKLKSLFYDFLEINSTPKDGNVVEQYYDELIRLKKKLGKLSTFEKQVDIIDKQLFSHKVNLPKKIHPGLYKIKMTSVSYTHLTLPTSG